MKPIVVARKPLCLALPKIFNEAENNCCIRRWVGLLAQVTISTAVCDIVTLCLMIHVQIMKNVLRDFNHWLPCYTDSTCIYNSLRYFAK